MAYVKQNFETGQTLTADALNHMEDGIYAASVASSSGSSAPSNVVDLIMFMGQSNMAGRGVASEAPVVPEGHGYEFKAITDPTKLYPIVEPFGVNENSSVSGVTESTKTGSMVSAFAIEYYKRTGVPIVGVSCSKGGTEIAWWLGKPLTDAVTRHNTAKAWLTANGYIIRNDYMVWCQGETDSRLGTSADSYKSQLKSLIETMKENGVQKCFIIRIGNKKDNATYNDKIILVQNEFCREYEDAVMVSTMLAGFAEQGLMKDDDHFKQPAYNLAGTDAAKNTSFFVNTGIEPYMYDPELKTVYFPYGDISGSGSTIEVDTSLDITSENPVQNKIVATEIINLTDLVNDLAQGEFTSYTVTYNLTNAVCSYSPSSVFEGRVFNTKVIPSSNHYIKSINVTMGGTDITSFAVSDTTISIDGVSGDIVITVVAEVYADLLTFTFDSIEENGVDLSQAGTVSDGKITLATPAEGSTNALTLANSIRVSPDSSFTIEVIAEATSTTGVILGNRSSTSGAFLNLKSNNSAAAFRFRDFNRTFSVMFGTKSPLTGKHHYAIVYDSSTKTFNGYIDGIIQDVVFEDGTVSTFTAFEFTDIFGGYRGSSTTYSDFVGDVYYLRVVDRALSTSEFHTE